MALHGGHTRGAGQLRAGEGSDDWLVEWASLLPIHINPLPHPPLDTAPSLASSGHTMGLGIFALTNLPFIIYLELCFMTNPGYDY